MQSSLFCRHTRSGFPPRHFCITHLSNMSRLQLPAPSLANARSHGLDCPSYGLVRTRMDLLLVWTRLRDGLPVCIWSWLPPGGSHQNARLQMTKDAFGGPRVIHGQKWPIRDEISQKLDLYPDRLKSGVLCRPRPHNHPHMGFAHAKVPQILLVGSVPAFAHQPIQTHFCADTPS